MASIIKTSTVNMEVTVYANSDNIAHQTTNAPLQILFAPTTSGEFYQSVRVSRTDSSANFSTKFEVGSSIVPINGTIGSVIVSGLHSFTEASGLAYSDASGTTVTVNGSYPSGSSVHNVSIDFSEGDRSSYGGITASSSGTFSQSHTYSYPGIFHITQRVQGTNGSVDMDSFRLNMASDLSGSGLGALTISASPESGSITSVSGLSIAMSATGASGVSLGATEDESLIWRLGNLERSSKTSLTTQYLEPGSYIPIANYLFAGPSGSVYISDITSTGAND
jgi:hypothetical protein